jgi:hypothetical protein
VERVDLNALSYPAVERVDLNALSRPIDLNGGLSAC